MAVFEPEEPGNRIGNPRLPVAEADDTLARASVVLVGAGLFQFAVVPQLTARCFALQLILEYTIEAMVSRASNEVILPVIIRVMHLSHMIAIRHPKLLEILEEELESEARTLLDEHRFSPLGLPDGEKLSADEKSAVQADLDDAVGARDGEIRIRLSKLQGDLAKSYKEHGANWAGSALIIALEAFVMLMSVRVLHYDIGDKEDLDASLGDWREELLSDIVDSIFSVVFPVTDEEKNKSVLTPPQLADYCRILLDIRNSKITSTAIDVPTIEKDLGDAMHECLRSDVTQPDVGKPEPDEPKSED